MQTAQSNFAINATNKVKNMRHNILQLNGFSNIVQIVFLQQRVEVAKDVCDAVTEIWEASPTNKVILNLPAAVGSFYTQCLYRSNRMDAP